AYELSTLTGTQVLLLVVSETGLVYTFTTPKLQPLVTKAEGKNLIQACLHAPDKESTPDNTAADHGTPEENNTAEYEDHAGASPQSSSHPSPQQSQQQPPPYSSQQQQQQQQQGGYGSSSAMNVPTYPHPYNHIPFPAQYNYPNMNVHYQNPSNAPPPPPNYGGGQYWSGPPPQQSPPTSSAPPPLQKGGRKGDK
ncbi:transcription factor of the MADS box, partial [Mortierella sp. AD094]